MLINTQIVLEKKWSVLFEFLEVSHWTSKNNRRNSFCSQLIWFRYNTRLFKVCT